MAVVQGFGSKVQVNDGGGASYQDFNNVTNITPPSPEIGDVDTSHLGLSSKVKTFDPGWEDPGEIKVEARFTDAEWQRLMGLKGTSKSFKVITPGTGTTASFNGYIKKVESELAYGDDAGKLTTTIKISGSITLA